jgi:hypothetical protein
MVSPSHRTSASLRIAQYFEPTTEDVVGLPEPYDLEPPIEPTEAQIEADHKNDRLHAPVKSA